MKDIEYPTEKLKISDWDPRTEHKNEKKRAEADKKYINLLASIKENGIRVPIMVVAKGNGYEVVGGRHRFKAAQELGLKTVPISIHEDATTKTDSIALSGIENYFRMDPEEKGLSRWTVAMYEAEGYKAKDVGQAVKAIDNWFSNHTNNKTDWDEFDRIHNSVMYSKQAGGKKINPILLDKKFIALCKRVGFSPKYQYQLISIIQKLNSSVIDKAEKKGLSTAKQISLTTGPLPEHPTIQKELIDQIADLPIEKARTRVQEVASDLSSGRLKKEGTRYTSDYHIKREDGKVLPPINVRIIDINTSINNFLFNMTQRAITKGEHEMSEQFVKNTKDYRLEVLKTLDERNLINLEKGLRLVQLVTDEMLGLIDGELESAKMKEKMNSK